MICSYAPMDEKKLDSLQRLEEEMGQTLLAYSCHNMKPAELTPEQVERLKKVEEELGVVIVAL